jgi:hypothetical protein
VPCDETLERRRTPALICAPVNAQIPAQSYHEREIRFAEIAEFLKRQRCCKPTLKCKIMLLCDEMYGAAVKPSRECSFVKAAMICYLCHDEVWIVRSEAGPEVQAHAFA